MTTMAVCAFTVFVLEEPYFFPYKVVSKNVVSNCYQKLGVAKSSNQLGCTTNAKSIIKKDCPNLGTTQQCGGNYEAHKNFFISRQNVVNELIFYNVGGSQELILLLPLLPLTGPSSFTNVMR
jgi:hypothetical protein